MDMPKVDNPEYITSTPSGLRYTNPEFQDEVMREADFKLQSNIAGPV